MVKSYCVKQKKQTECVEPSGYKTAKSGRLMFWCSCAEWVVPEKIHTPPTDGILEVLAGGGVEDSGNPGGRGG